MKSVTNSNWGFDVHPLPLKCVKPRPWGKTSAFNLHECPNDMLSKSRLEHFLELELWKLAKYYRNEMLSKVRQNRIGKIKINYSASAKMVVLNKVGGGHGLLGPLPWICYCTRKIISCSPYFIYCSYNYRCQDPFLTKTITTRPLPKCMMDDV